MLEHKWKQIKVFFGRFMERDFWKQFFSMIATLSSIATLITFITKWPDGEISSCTTIMGATFIILSSVIYAIIMTNRKQRIVLPINPNLKVTVEHGDLFRQHGIIVIPVNEYFDTLVDDVVIDHGTVHGQFIERLFPNDIDNLDFQISQALQRDGHQPIEHHQRSAGKEDRYNLGTCISINKGGNTYVLFAFTHFNDNQNAWLDPNDVSGIIVKLMTYLQTNAHNRPVYMPVFGIGLSRLGKTPQRMLLYTLECIDFMCYNFKIKKGLHIECFDMLDYNLNAVEDYFYNNILNKPEE